MATRAARLLQEYVRLGAEGDLDIDYHQPKAPAALRTQLRHDPAGHPRPYVKNRRTPDGVNVPQVLAYKKDDAPTPLLRAIKAVPTPAATQLVRRAAVFLAPALRAYSIDAVMPAPSSKPLAALLAQELATRLGALPVLAPVEKVGSMTKLGVMDRMKAAATMFQASAQPQLRGTILVVDDYITSGATVIGLATALYAVTNRQGYHPVTQIVVAALAGD